MAVFLRPNRGVTVAKYVRGELAESVQLLQHLEDVYCVSLISTNIPMVLKDKDGESVKDSLLKAGQRASLDLGSMEAEKYHLMLIPHPELARSCYVGGPILIEPRTTERLQYLLRVEKQISLDGLPYLFRVYMVD